MTVSELINILKNQDPNAQIFVMSQPGWPQEYGVTGVAVRKAIIEEDYGDDDSRYENGTAANDVFIVEGTQLRRGSKAAWSVVGR